MDYSYEQTYTKTAAFADPNFKKELDFEPHQKEKDGHEVVLVFPHNGNENM